LGLLPIEWVSFRNLSVIPVFDVMRWLTGDRCYV
jgi:hypothetical protein